MSGIRQGGMPKDQRLKNRQQNVLAKISLLSRNKPRGGQGKLRLPLTILIIDVLVAIIKKQLKLELKLSEILQILSITLFEKVSLAQALTQNVPQNKNCCSCNQLLLPDL